MAVFPGLMDSALYARPALCGRIPAMERKEEKTSLILHGHFYQPPRENPFTGRIPKQDSAAPYLDWNERIYKDCYSANAHSRYLSPEGRIISITNNFSYISFNFGPTLLSWMDKEHPMMIEMLKEADRESIKRLGHGNAMAQAFNHTILPLDKYDDAKLQIEWGAMDFENRFGRKPEGMWLPEAAINGNVIDLLAEEGIRFVILSPWQCAAVENASGTVTPLQGKPAPYWEPYILTGRTGKEITAFFYHPGLAEGISFGHMLRSADNLYATIKSISDTEKRPLIHTATDGEIYGHHEPYGDMALAALIRKVEERTDFVMDNYASYLDRHPAVLHAELHAGEDGLGTSWSCSHGVSRWYKDCGCSTGSEPGWNQAWRTPLRNGLRNLADKLDAIFAAEIRRIFGDKITPMEILEMAGGEITGRISMRSFLESLHKKLSFASTYDVELARLLSGIKSRHFSFTSCGFFFAEISGIEPRQDIKYALYAIRMFQPYYQGDLLYPFLSDLRKAKSNIKGMGDGMNIAQEEMKGLPGEVEAALYFFLNRSIAAPDSYKEEYGRFILSHLDMDSESFSCDIIDKVNLELYRFSVLSSSSVENGINLYISENNESNTPIQRIRITNQDIPGRMLAELFEWIEKAMNGTAFSELSIFASDIRHFAMLVKNTRFMQIDTMMLENLGLSLKLIRSYFASCSDASPAEKRETIGSLLGFVRKCGRDSDIKALNAVLSGYASRLAVDAEREGLTDSIASCIIELMEESNANSLTPEIRDLQDTIYPYYRGDAKPAASLENAAKAYSLLNFK